MKCQLFAVMSLILHLGSRICCVKFIMVHCKDLVVLHVVAHTIWLKNVRLDYQEIHRRGLFNSKAVSQKPTDEEVGRILAPVKHSQKIRQTKIRNVMQSPQLVTKGQQNKRIAVSPQLETKGQQNKRIVQQNGKQSPQLRAKVIQRKQRNVKRSPQLESVQSETSHQIKEMREQGDVQYRQSGNVQNEHQPDNSKNQLQLVDTSCLDNSVATSQVMQYPQSENVHNEHRPGNNKNQPQLVDSSCQESSFSTSQVMQYPQSDDVLKEHQPDNSQYQLQLVDTSNLDNSGDNSAATSQDLQSPQSGNVQNQHCSSKSYPQRDNYKYQPQLVDMSCKDSSASTSQYLQFPQSGKIQNGHHPNNNKRQRQLEDSLRQDSSLASYLQSPQSGNVQNGHQTDNNKNQPQLVDSSCLDDSVATSEAIQYPQSEKVQNQHQPDDNKYQPQLVGTSCLDNYVATSEVNDPQSDNIKNQHFSYQPYPHLDIRTSQPQQVDTSHQESSTSREDLDSTSNWQDAKKSPQRLMESNQDQTNKPYLLLNIRTYQPQQVNSSCKESSKDPTSGKGVVSAVSKDVMQYLQLEAVLYSNPANIIHSWIIGLINRSGLILHVKKALMIRLQAKK